MTKVFYQSYVETFPSPLSSFPVLPETILITIGSEGMNSHSPVLLPARLTPGNLAWVQPFPEHHPSCCVRSALFVHFVEGQCLTDMYIVTSGTSTSSHLTQEYPLPAHDSLEKLDMTLRGLLSTERVWVWRAQNQLTACTHTHTHTLSLAQHRSACTSSEGFPYKSLSSLGFFISKPQILLGNE